MEEFRLPVFAIATVEDLLTFMAGQPELAHEAAEVTAYRGRYGVAA
jgi:orotate phosphoribosyltransferase